MNTQDTCEIRAAVIKTGLRGDILQNTRSLASKTRCCIVCLDADRMAGKSHVESAVYHALRAWQEGRAIADSLEMEILLYAGGTRQTSIGRDFGVCSDTRNVYLCFVPPSDVAIKEMESWVQYIADHDERLNPVKVRRLMDLFGITREEILAVGDDHIRDLVLERVALLDVYK